MATLAPATGPRAVEHEAIAPAVVKFHLSLNVANLDASVAFYRVLFGVEPAKCYPDYAKFELAEPPLALSLEPQPHAAGGALNHLGFRLSGAPALVEMQRRLESAGISTTREQGVECCYARQSKFWVLDPDRNNWEMYVIEADVDHRGGHPPSSVHAALKHASPPAGSPDALEIVWEHQLGEDFPDRIPLADGAADRVLLRGTFNTPRSGDEIVRILSEARRVLRQGGRVLAHGLVADSPVDGASLQLPGPAAAVSHVPTESELPDAMGAAGFAGLRLVKLSATPVFRHEGVGLREIRLEGTKLDPSRLGLTQTLLYKGPLRQLTDDEGNVFPRGRRKRVSSRAAELLRLGPAAESFVFFPAGDEGEENPA